MVDPNAFRQHQGSTAIIRLPQTPLCSSLFFLFSSLLLFLFSSPSPSSLFSSFLSLFFFISPLIFSFLFSTRPNPTIQEEVQDVQQKIGNINCLSLVVELNAFRQHQGSTALIQPTPTPPRPSLFFFLFFSLLLFLLSFLSFLSFFSSLTLIFPLLTPFLPFLLFPFFSFFSSLPSFFLYLSSLPSLFFLNPQSPSLFFLFSLLFSHSFFFFFSPLSSPLSLPFFDEKRRKCGAQFPKIQNFGKFSTKKPKNTRFYKIFDVLKCATM